MKKIFVFLMIFCLAFGSTSFALTASDELPEALMPLPSIPEGEPQEYSQSVVFFANNRYYLWYWHSSEPFDIDLRFWGTNKFQWTPSGEVRWTKYQSTNGTTWGTTGTSSPSVQPQSFSYTTERIYSSTVNVYDSEGNLFFQAPPVVPEGTLAQVIREEMLKFLTTQVGTMKILTVCGVGLIALLVALNLFGKVLRPYLQR